MMDLLTGYWPVFVAAIFVSMALSTQGHFTLARSQGPVILALSQFAILGHLLGKAFLPVTEDSEWLSMLPSFGSYFLGLVLLERRSLRDITLISVFIVLMALNHQLISLMPKLDSHMAANLFGDIATVSDRHAFAMGLFSLGFVCFFLLKKKTLLKEILEEVHYGVKTEKTDLFRLMGHGLLFVSLYEMGFLFTMSFLILPSLILSVTAKSFESLVNISLVLASLGAGTGLITSLYWGKLSTMPTQILFLILFLACAHLMSPGRKTAGT